MAPAFVKQAGNLVFFDREKVFRAMDKAKLRALSKFGAFVRTRARTSMRKRKKPSAPGTPPSAHVGTLKKLLYFAYDPATKSVVVGPVPFGAAARQNVGAPEVNEYGGTVRRLSTVLVNRAGGRGRKATPRQRAAVLELIRDGRIDKAPTRKVRDAAQYPPRPYMRPALAAERPKFAAQFQDSLGR